MAQQALFPMDVLRVTQGYGYVVDGVPAATFSHANQYALDLGGADGGMDYIYAPFDCTVKRIYGDYNAVWFESDEPVLCADGKTRIVVMECIHMYNSDRTALGVVVGKKFKQGQKCYREGSAGHSTGNHLHMEVGEGPFANGGWHSEKTATGATQWPINNKLIPHQVFFVGPNTKVVTPKYNWKKSTDVPTVDTAKFTSLTNKALRIYASNCEYFNTTSVANPLGKLENGGCYQCTGECAESVNGFPWAKIIYNGATVYVALPSDGRAKIEDAPAGLFPTTTTTTTVQTPATSTGLSAGDRVLLSGQLYASSTAQSGYSKRGYYYVYDNHTYNGRVRLTNLPERVGKVPPGTYVSGYANPANLSRM